ncbi:MAG TPA: hypothetical protein VIN66_04300 [Rheinheimera sp.]
MRIELLLFLNRFNRVEVISVLLALPLLLHCQPPDLPLWACALWQVRPNA